MTAQSKPLQDQVLRLVNLVRESFVPDSPTHDISHLARVASLASQICSDEGGNQLVAISASWLHDLHREAQGEGGDFFVSPEQLDERAQDILKCAGIPDDTHLRILEAIHYTDRFSFSDRSLYDTTIEAKAVRDADCLDAIGAIGIARAFSFGGAHNIPIWDGAALAEGGIYQQSERPASTIHHFYDKLLRVASQLETPTAVKLATSRHAYLRGFIDQFMEELHEDMNSVSWADWTDWAGRPDPMPRT
jgi:uncharacterized protein